MLVQILEDETVLPVAPAKWAAARAPHAEIKLYQGLDHFDIYTGAGFETLNADQLLFLARHVPATSRASV